MDVQPFTAGDLREYVLDSGWRMFAELWDTAEPAALREHALLFPKLAIIEGVPEYPGAVLTFAIDSQRFAVLRSQGDYLFFVENPDCDVELLLGVARYFNSFLRPICRLSFYRLQELDSKNHE